MPEGDPGYGQADSDFASNSRLIDSEADVAITSVGLDIGSTTTHFVLTRIVLGLVAGRYVVSSFQALHESEVRLTPYESSGAIDAATLGRWLDEQYRTCEIRPGDVDTGVVLLTGNALLRENSRAIADLFAQAAGTFVSVAAGHHMEASLAARGSGALGVSRQEHARILHIDIGGGTTKLAVCDNGRLIATAAIDVGARILEIDDAGVLIRAVPSGERIGQALKLDLKIGERVATADRRRLASRIAEIALDVIYPNEGGAQYHGALLTDALPVLGSIDAITFSGGVAEYIYRREQATFGDLGAEIGAAIRERTQCLLAEKGIPTKMLSIGIRATVMGTSRNTVQLSGETVVVHPPDVLPLANVPVVTVHLAGLDDDLASASLADRIWRERRVRGLVNRSEPVAIAIPWHGPATYTRLHTVALGLVKSMEQSAQRRPPIVVVTNEDVGGLLGLHLRHELGVAEVVSLDGLRVDDFDFLDIGRIAEGTGAVPVVVKSMLFPGEAQAAAVEPSVPAISG
jgi:ethanolamine utilization protein EutA